MSAVEELNNRHNDRILATKSNYIPKHVRLVPRALKPPSVMEWAGVPAIGKTRIVFEPERVKINAESCEDHIIERIVKELSETIFAGRPFRFEQDGAPALTLQTEHRSGAGR